MQNIKFLCWFGTCLLQMFFLIFRSAKGSFERKGQIYINIYESLASSNFSFFAHTAPDNREKELCQSEIIYCKSVFHFFLASEYTNVQIFGGLQSSMQKPE